MINLIFYNGTHAPRNPKEYIYSFLHEKQRNICIYAVSPSPEYFIQSHGSIMGHMHQEILKSIYSFLHKKQRNPFQKEKQRNICIPPKPPAAANQRLWWTTQIFPYVYRATCSPGRGGWWHAGFGPGGRRWPPWTGRRGRAMWPGGTSTACRKRIPATFRAQYQLPDTVQSRKNCNIVSVMIVTSCSLL